MADGEQRYEELVGRWLAVPGVTPPGQTAGFGSHALRVDGRIFTMLVRGRLVVKLPRSRVDELVQAGHGVRFDANKGTPMKEWLSLDPAARLDWLDLSGEAFAFVSGQDSPLKDGPLKDGPL
jgi:hypothetical protein